MARPADTQPIAAHPEQAPLLSKGVVKVWEVYGAMSGDEEEKAQIRSAEIAATLHDFVGLKGLVLSTYEAAYLIEIMEKQNSDDSFEAANAHEAIYSYKGKTQQDTDYVRGIAADRLEIGKFLAEHYEQSKMRRAVNQSERSVWLPSDEVEISLRDIFHLTSDIAGEGVEDPLGVNIESILISAASAYNTLRNDEDFTEEELLKTIYDIESLYEPFLAYIRFDGFEMALKEVVGLVRAKYGQGVEGIITQHDIDYADMLLHQTGLDDYANVKSTVPKVLTSLYPNSDATADSVLHHISGHGVKIGVATLYRESDPDYLDFDAIDDSLNDSRFSVRWRAKGRTSIAENNYEKPGKYIADLLGLTVIVPNYESVAEMMATAYRSLETFLSVEAKSSASRDTAISIKGTTMPAVVLPVLTDLLADLDPKIETKTSDNGHQVGKITFQYENNYRGKKYFVPVEIMFQTPEDREVSNIGEGAHALKPKTLRKTSNNELVDDVAESETLTRKKYRPLTEQEIRFQRRFHERRMIISSPGLTERSRERSEQLFPSKRKNKRGMGGLGVREFIRSDRGGTI